MLTTIFVGLVILAMALVFYEAIFSLREIDVTVTERVT